MVVLDLFPVGIHQLIGAMSEGYARARSQTFIDGTLFQTLTWLRGLGVLLFVAGGVLPLAWFVVTRGFSLKPARDASKPFVVPPTVLAMAGESGPADGPDPA
jgi:nitric oxide reductase subunit B